MTTDPPGPRIARGLKRVRAEGRRRVHLDREDRNEERAGSVCADTLGGRSRIGYGRPQVVVIAWIEQRAWQSLNNRVFGDQVVIETFNKVAVLNAEHSAAARKHR